MATRNPAGRRPHRRTHDPRPPNAAALHFLADENGTDPVRLNPPGAVGEPFGDDARSVAFGCSSTAAIAASASSTGPSPSTGETDVTTSFPSGERPGLVDAEDVDAREPLHRRQLLDEDPPLRRSRTTAAANAMVMQEDESLGHHRHRSRNRAGDRLAPAVGAPELADEQERARGHDRPGHPHEDAVDPGAELGAG